jgi:ribosomal protein L11 methyltransferase
MTTVASLTTSQSIACRLADVLAERLDPHDAIVSTFEADDGRWRVAIYFQRPPDKEAVRQIVSSIGGPGSKRALQFETLRERDWVASSLQGLKPVAAGRFVVHGRHDRARVLVNQVGIEIEAALAFGTGHHGTTRGCLLALHHLLKGRRLRRILDVGTGSGVLAIAAAKTCRRRVLASDIDRNAVAAATQNARANQVGALVAVIRADGVRDRRIRSPALYDLIFANIVLNPLKRLAAPLARLAAPRGFIVLSGLLRSQANAALAACRLQGLALEHRIVLDGWATLVLTRRRYSLPEQRPSTRQLENLTGWERLPPRSRVHKVA